MKTFKNGFALSIVMWIVVALLFGVALILLISKDNIDLTNALNDKIEAKSIAQDYLQKLKFYILTSNFDNISIKGSFEDLPHRIILDGRWYKIGNTSFSLQDASSMINVLYPNVQNIAALATKDDKNERYYTIRDSIDDWRDKDNLVKLNGAEEAYYALQKRRDYVPRNAKVIQSVEELRLIKGLDTLDKASWEKLKQNLFYSQNGATVNLALISQEYLAKILKLNFLEAHVLQTYREKDFQKFIKLLKENKNYNSEYMGLHLSFNILIKIRTKVKNSRSELETMILFRPTKDHYTTTSFYNIY